MGDTWWEIKTREDPFDGLKRETKEETGIDIDIKNPIRVHHFAREDGQKITMITFLCSPLSTSINLSEEHSEHEWTSIDDSISKIFPAFQEDVRILSNLSRDQS